VSHVKVYLSKEEGITWRHIWTNQSFTASEQEIQVQSPLQSPAVLIKEPREDKGLLDDLLSFCSNK
jgi:alpha-glucosidase (family GH31 glycosyl hydrolase)